MSQTRQARLFTLRQVLWIWIAEGVLAQVGMGLAEGGNVYRKLLVALAVGSHLVFVLWLTGTERLTVELPVDRRWIEVWTVMAAVGLGPLFWWLALRERIGRSGWVGKAKVEFGKLFGCATTVLVLVCGFVLLVVLILG